MGFYVFISVIKLIDYKALGNVKLHQFTVQKCRAKPGIYQNNAFASNQSATTPHLITLTD